MAPFATASGLVKRLALQAGFDAAGIAGVRAEDLPELAYFEGWIERGHAGEMEYLKRRDEQGRLKRAALDRAAPWAKSVIVCALNYNPPHPYSTDLYDSERGWISRYAWSAADYHDSVLARLRQLESLVAEQCGDEDFRSWCYVDTGPLVERVYAKYAGIGWIGRNTCIIHQELGSWLFLGVILTSLSLEPDAPASDRCGTCTACIEACPTDALIAPYEMDARRCIAYLTIEKRGAIPEDLREGIGRNIFGCDICQDVCPWNRKAPVTAASEFQPRKIAVNNINGESSTPEDFTLCHPPLEWLLSLSEEEFRAVFRGSPVKRTRWRGLLRNACVAAGNSHLTPANPSYSRIMHRLGELARGDDALLAEHAQWALGKIHANESISTMVAKDDEI